MSNSGTQSTLVKLAWPALILIVILIFRDQITELSVSKDGTFSMVLAQTAEGNGAAEYASLIEGLSEQGVIALLDAGDKTMVMTNFWDGRVRLSDGLEGYQDLERNGLLETNVPLQGLSEENVGSRLAEKGVQDIEVKLNDKGERAWMIIAKSVSAALK